MPDLDLTLSEKNVYHFKLGPQEQSEINFRSGTDILLHIKAIRSKGIVVLNDHVSGNWRDELHLRIPEEKRNVVLDLSVEVDTIGATVTVPKIADVRFERSTDFFDCDRLAYTDSVGFSVEEPDVLPLSNNTARTHSISEGSFQIVSAHRNSIDVSVSGAHLHAGDYLAASVGGYECGRIALEDLNSSETKIFRIPVYNPSIVGDGMTVSVSIQGKDGEIQVAESATRLQYYGGLDRCSEQLVRGWAFDAHNPNKPVAVDIYLNDVYQGSVVADRSRNDLASLDARFKSTGFLFKFPKSVYLPESSDTKVSARPVNTEIDLDYSPWYICRRVRFQQ